MEEAKDKDGKSIKINGKSVYVKLSWTINTGYVTANDKKTKIEAAQATSGVKAEITDSNGKPLSFKKDDTSSIAKLAEMQSQLDSAGYDAAADCHGVSFAEGQVWINNNQVEKLLKADGYRAVVGSEQVQSDDIVVYSKGVNQKENGGVDLSGVAHSARMNSDLTTVTSKSGILPLQRSMPVGPGKGSAWESEKTKITVWTLRAKP